MNKVCLAKGTTCRYTSSTLLSKLDEVALKNVDRYAQSLEDSDVDLKQQNHGACPSVIPRDMITYITAKLALVVERATRRGT